MRCPLNAVKKPRACLSAMRQNSTCAPVEVHIVTGCAAITIQAHAVQLALQGGLGFTLPVRAIWLPGKHQRHCLHVKPRHVRYMEALATRSISVIACMSSRTNIHTGIRLIACMSTDTYMLHGKASTSLPACQVTLAYIQKASVMASIHERSQCLGQCARSNHIQKASAPCLHVKSHQHVAWESNTFIACVSSHTNLCIESIGVMRTNCLHVRVTLTHAWEASITLPDCQVTPTCDCKT